METCIESERDKETRRRREVAIKGKKKEETAFKSTHGVTRGRTYRQGVLLGYVLLPK